MDRSFILLLVASIILMLSLGFIAYYKSESITELEITAQAELDKSCNLNKQACTLTIPKVGKITFSILPQPIPLVTELSLSVKTDIKDIDQIVVDFAGIDMQMGPNKVLLNEINTLKSTGREYSGKGMLPVCIRYSMNWLASVYIETSDGLYMAPFQFETRK
jgi:hypothetical protein